ncbi:MAG TPA: 2-oxoacid:ferredoxin oxidoreductase subunit gamma [Syntrophaceae bacterium]|jgi:2-oxoglutarate ferredoxin oxidoreductase subunit gamma|nr:2-oxoacid:ferredoxin oxidoreductase subunit gamma [Syntrophaceae bacterium]
MIENDYRNEIRFCGSGGQGIIMAAIVLAEAAGVYDGKYVCQTQSYGPEARGGTCKADVVISSKEIDYPKASRPTLLVAMNQASCDKYFLDLNPKGLLIVDTTYVKKVPTGRVAALPFTRIARQETGNTMAANMVALGAFGHLYKNVTAKSLEDALMARVPKGTEEVNLLALRAGMDAAKHLDLCALPQLVREEEV